MTLNALIKCLELLREKHGGKAKVCINAGKLDTGNGTWNICEMQSIHVEYVRQVDGDGWQEVLADGSEKMKKCVVIC